MQEQLVGMLQTGRRLVVSTGRRKTSELGVLKEEERLGRLELSTCLLNLLWVPSVLHNIWSTQAD